MLSFLFIITCNFFNNSMRLSWLHHEEIEAQSDRGICSRLHSQWSSGAGIWSQPSNPRACASLLKIHLGTALFPAVRWDRQAEARHRTWGLDGRGRFMPRCRWWQQALVREVAGLATGNAKELSVRGDTVRSNGSRRKWWKNQESVFPRHLERLAASGDFVKVSVGSVKFRGRTHKWRDTGAT